MSVALRHDTLDFATEKSVPTLTEFNPNLVPYQMRVINDIRANFDYSLGVHEILLSGSVGSAKSILAAHLAVTHCLLFPGAVCMIGRKSMPALKDTLLQMILDHLGIDVKYQFNSSRGQIHFPNKSKIICHSWSDKKYKKIRSYALSMAIVEELTENDDPEFFKEIRMRLNRIPHIPEKIMLGLTNPDAPSHWAYGYFIEAKYKTRHVYYSVTSDNPFLDKTYIQQLKNTLTSKEALRMLYGQWVELSQDIIYYNYDEGRNFINRKREIDYDLPLDFSFDFNIGVGKPMSCVLMQYDGKFHAIREFVVEGARTHDILDEIESSGILNRENIIVRVFGDASGKNNDTRSKKSDYDIIKKFFVNHEYKGNPNINYVQMVPRANPPVRKRHNLVNSQFLNDNNIINFYCYKDAKTVNKGLKLAKLKKNSGYIEDDSDYFQHVTTALGYYIVRMLIEEKRLNKEKTIRI